MRALVAPMNHLPLALLLLFASTAQAGSFDCLPAQLGGPGTRATWGLQATPLQFWAGWKCGAKLNVAACAGVGCSKPLVAQLVPAFEQAPRRTLKAANGLLVTLETTSINDPVLRAVWLPHKAEMEALK